MPETLQVETQFLNIFLRALLEENNGSLTTKESWKLDSLLFKMRLFHWRGTEWYEFWNVLATESLDTDFVIFPATQGLVYLPRHLPLKSTQI